VGSGAKEMFADLYDSESEAMEISEVDGFERRMPRLGREPVIFVSMISAVVVSDMAGRKRSLAPEI